MDHCNKILALLIANPQAAARRLNEDSDEEEEEVEEGMPPPVQRPASSTARGFTVSSLASFVEKLDDELFKALQLTDVHTEQYQERLGASVHLITLLKASLHFCEQEKDARGQLHYTGELSRIALRLVEHLYYKHDD